MTASAFGTTKKLVVLRVRSDVNPNSRGGLTEVSAVWSLNRTTEVLSGYSSSAASRQQHRQQQPKSLHFPPANRSASFGLSLLWQVSPNCSEFQERIPFESGSHACCRWRCCAVVAGCWCCWVPPLPPLPPKSLQLSPTPPPPWACRWCSNNAARCLIRASSTPSHWCRRTPTTEPGSDLGLICFDLAAWRTTTKRDRPPPNKARPGVGATVNGWHCGENTWTNQYWTSRATLFRHCTLTRPVSASASIRLAADSWTTARRTLHSSNSALTALQAPTPRLCTRRLGCASQLRGPRFRTRHHRRPGPQTPRTLLALRSLLLNRQEGHHTATSVRHLRIGRDPLRGSTQHGPCHERHILRATLPAPAQKRLGS